VAFLPHGYRRSDSPGVRENALAVRALTPAIAARAQSYLFMSAGAVGALGVLLPHPPRFQESHMLAVQVFSMIAGVLLWLVPQWAPRWFLAIGPYGAAAATSAAVVASGEGTSAYMLFYLWVAFYAFYFLTRRGAASLALFTLVNYAGVLAWFRWAGPAAGSLDNADISAMVLVTGTLVCAGVFILLLRERVGALIGQLSDAASTDHLTGLLNRRGFQQALERELARAQRSGQSFSLLLGDCDFFKHLNDSLGHAAGDQALLMIGRMLEGERRGMDVAARIGGEEFAVLLPECEARDAYLAAERLRTRFAALFASQPLPLTMSFGVAAFPANATTDDGLLRAADDALYAAKALGRDRTVLHSAEIKGILAARQDEEPTGDEHIATVVNLAQALDMRDAGTARHSESVGEFCAMMGRELGLDPQRVERLRLAGLLHDIGKIGVPDAILKKPGSLTSGEVDQMRKHPEIGARILGGSGLGDIREWVLAHHERPDGTGYPRGLHDRQIPLEAKILAVGDAFEAMTADRVYRRAIGPEAAREELLAGAGTQFDPVVVHAFLRALSAAGAVSRSALCT
jgi:diguanylate cyclase (GGDEF)-like protein/putative nucleotidyltransferase with HDIG domain